MVMQYLPNDVSKGKAAFPEYQWPAGIVQVTYALAIRGLKSCPPKMCQRFTAWAIGISVLPNSLSSILRSCPYTSLRNCKLPC
jgi:hypothetical protein